jgi:DNA-binding NarL/FixJ family response regulator
MPASMRHLSMPRLLVVEQDQPLRERVVSMLKRGGFQVDAVGTALEAQPSLAGKLDLVLTGLEIPDIDGVDFIRQFVKSSSGIPVIVLARRSDGSRVIAAIRSGVRGCLFVDDLKDRLLPAVKEALAGGRPMSRGLGPMLMEHVRQSGRHSSHERQAAKPLTEREKEVLQQLARGLSYEDIGKLLAVSVNTVRSHVRTIYDKFEVNSRTEAVLLAMKLGLVKRTPYPFPTPRY